MKQAKSKILLYGTLAQKYGREHNLCISSARDAASALAARNPGFERDVLDTPGISYAIYVDDDNIGEHELDFLVKGRTVKIVPIISGANRGILQVVAGAALIGFAVSNPFGWTAAAGSWAAAGLTAASGLGVSLAFGGIAQMLAPSSKGIPATDASKSTSYTFQGAVNTTAVGLPVPVLIGRMRTGSRVISASIKTQNTTDDSSQLTSSARASFLDLISEGPVVGLVGGAEYNEYYRRTAMRAKNLTINGVTANDRQSLPSLTLI